MSGDTPRSARIEQALAIIAQDLRSMANDLAGLRRDLDDAQKEYRNEIRALRGDLALSESRQNSEIESNKKKSPGSFAGSPAFTAAWWTPRKHWLSSSRSSSRRRAS